MESPHEEPKAKRELLLYSQSQDMWLSHKAVARGTQIFPSITPMKQASKQQQIQREKTKGLN
jgi:hypothetical protein